MSGLPEGWAEAALGELAVFVMGQAPPGSASNYDGIGTPFVKAGEFGEVRPIIREWTTMPLKMAEEGDVLICVVGATSGKINLGANCAIGRSVAAIRPKGAIDQFYLHSFMKTQVEDMRRGSTGTAQGVISSAMLANVTVPLAPLPEQKRIVAKVDGLTARTARARTDLARIPTLIARYKQRLLALAFSGELTAGWRASRNLPEPKSALLSDILAIPVRNGLSVRGSDDPPGVRALRLSALRGTEVNLNDVRYLPIGPQQASRFLLSDGDILISRGNGTRAFVGIGSRVPALTEETIFPDTTFRIRLDPDYASPRWFVSIWNSPQVRSQIEDAAKTTAGIWKVAQSDLARIQILLPTTTEQTEITRRIESAFNWLDRMAADHAAAANLLPKLDAAILARAFRGALVPQDPNDEPAAELLARIKAQQLDAPKKGRGRDVAMRPPKLPDDLAPPTIRRPAGDAAMTKSRQDDDVMGKPYLADLIKAGRGSTAQDLFKASDLPVADFYKQLAWEIGQKHIRDDDEKLEAL